MKRIEKGTPGYLDYKKKVEIIRTVIYFLLVAAIFTLGYVQTKTRSNLLTVVAILGCLPAAKALVGVITRFPYASVDQKLVHEVDTKAPHTTRVYDLVLTTRGKNHAGGVCGDLQRNGIWIHRQQKGRFKRPFQTYQGYDDAESSFVFHCEILSGL